MNVAIYHPWIYLKSGLERTILELVRRSRHEWTVYTSHFDPQGTYPELSSVGIRELRRVSVERRYGAVIAAAATIAATRLDLCRHDALVVCCDGLGSLLNFRNHRVPTLCLCFTPLRAVYDEEYRRRRLPHGPVARPLALLAERAYRALDAAAWRRYDRAVCISETVKRRVERGGLRPSGPLDVAYPGVPADRIRPVDDDEGYFFLPGRIMWTKNLELAIEGFRLFKARTASRFRLVIAGMVDRKSRPYAARLRALAAPCPDVEFRTDLDDEAMQRGYRGCSATVLAAFNEDLGLTPLEAGCHGKPTIAVARGGPTELVVDGDTGLLVEPTPEAFARAMTRLAADPEGRRAMGRRAAERCRLFTWERFVDHVDRALDTMLEPLGDGDAVRGAL